MKTIDEKARINLRYVRYQDFFSTLTEEEFELLASVAQFRCYPAGQILFEEDDELQRVYYILEGMIRFERVDASDNHLFYDYIGQHNFFPISSIFTDETYTYRSVTRTKVRLLVFPRIVIEQVLAGNHQSLLDIAKTMAGLLERNEKRIQNVLNPNAQDRVRQSLIYLKDILATENAGDYTIPYPLTIKELATNSATSTETVRQTMNELVEKGLLQYESKLLIFPKKRLEDWE
ncbi:cAMP-binding domain of CRP or a regulatory subunit of cAMP-dependent protein kinases [Pilibacter termitis]|uniref:cAMP-binding domain of CRP or a regulatory subunit of cAMP-dependent protein kinases n=1 Tax=Pilibacter termitis TaxID=263852 RepID=A0A1T4QSS5_9ENTE|nr:Crp/Fnr family transcriptional regulator [Pilibacter termitis]SKA06802.1 cAMP-binding domain of CRP or a regulatory subunit of cAMP-dependent protein kinases [Pilibacter termitis]